MLIEIKLKDPEVIKFIGNIKDNELNDSLEKFIKLGINVSEITNTKLNLEESILEPITEIIEDSINNSVIINQMETLNRTIEEFKGSYKTPSLKGKIGENCVCDNIQKYFPECELKNTTSDAHQADFLFKLKDFPDILIEVKTYKNNIPFEQVNKFKRDLKTTGINCGIMVSTTSGISRKKQFDWEIEDNKTIVYIPNGGLDGYSVTWAIMFLKELSKFRNNDNLIKQGYEITNKLNSLKQVIIDIESTKTIIHRTKYNLLNNITSSFENLDKEIVHFDKKIKNFINYFD